MNDQIIKPPSEAVADALTEAKKNDSSNKVSRLEKQLQRIRLLSDETPSNETAKQAKAKIEKDLKIKMRENPDLKNVLAFLRSRNNEEDNKLALEIEEDFIKFQKRAIRLVLLSSVVEALNEINPKTDELKKQILDAENAIKVEAGKLREETFNSYLNVSMKISEKREEIKRLYNACNYMTCTIKPDRGLPSKIFTALKKAVAANPVSVVSTRIAEGYIAPFATSKYQAKVNETDRSLKSMQSPEEAELSIKRYRLPRGNQQSINVFEGKLTRTGKNTNSSNKIHVVFCHGNSDSAANNLQKINNMMAEILEKNSNIDVIEYSVVDYPKSSASGGSYKDITELAEASVVNLVEHKIKCGESPSNIVVMGHSLGGYIGLAGANKLRAKEIDVSFVSLDSFASLAGWMFNSNALEKVFAQKYSIPAVEYFERLNPARRFVSAKFGDEIIDISNSLLFGLNKNREAKDKYHALQKLYAPLEAIDIKREKLLHEIEKMQSPKDDEKIKKLQNQLNALKPKHEKLLEEFKQKTRDNPQLDNFRKLKVNLRQLRTTDRESRNYEEMHKTATELIAKLFPQIKEGKLQTYQGGHNASMNEDCVSTAIANVHDNRVNYKKADDEKIFSKIHVAFLDIMVKNRTLQSFLKKAQEFQNYAKNNPDKYLSDQLIQSKLLLGYLYDQVSKTPHGPFKNEFEKLLHKQYGYLKLNDNFLRECKETYESYKAEQPKVSANVTPSSAKITTEARNKQLLTPLPEPPRPRPGRS